MDIEKIKGKLMFDIIPKYLKSVGPCFTKESLKKTTETFLQQLVKLVFPDYTIILRGIEDTSVIK